MALLGAVALGLMLVLMVAGPWLFRLVFGAAWQEAGELARALAPYIAVHFVAAPLAVVTMAWKAQRWAFRWAVFGQAAFVAALGLGLKLGGLMAGAWAVSAAMVVYFGIYFWRLAFWRDIPSPRLRHTPVACAERRSNHDRSGVAGLPSVPPPARLRRSAIHAPGCHCSATSGDKAA